MDKTSEHNYSAHGDSEWLPKGEGCSICDYFYTQADELEPVILHRPEWVKRAEANALEPKELAR